MEECFLDSYMNCVLIINSNIFFLFFEYINEWTGVRKAVLFFMKDEYNYLENLKS